MGFRKIVCKPSLFFDFENEVEKRSIFKQEDKGSSVVFESESIEDLNFRQLDPRVITLESLIKKGTVINPGKISNILSGIDVADSDSWNEIQNQSVIDFLEKNREKLVNVESK